MPEMSKLSTCQLVCWGLAALAGLMAIWATAGVVGFLAALLLGVAFAVFFGLVVTRLVCVGYKPEDRGIEARDVGATLRHVTGITGYRAPDDEIPAPAADPVATVAMTEPAAQPAPEPGQVAVRTGTMLPGEAELAARRGSWTYEAPAAGTQETTGRRPAALDAPMGGKADDLKRIKGVGPKLERLCHELGFFHFEQIAGWGPEEVAWVDANLKGFKGRVSRDNWVEQARALAAGGDVE